MQESMFFDQLVKPDDTLDDDKVIERKSIYLSASGKSVERFTVFGEDRPQSYIFKPLNQPELLGRERWSQNHLLPSMSFRYPRLLGEAGQGNPSAYWIILEDLGELTHNWNMEVLSPAIRHIPHWQRLSTGMLPSSFLGQKPLFREVVSILRNFHERAYTLLFGLGVPQPEIDKLFALLNQADAIGDELVVSHGDLHIGNVAMWDREVIFLDWEHVHLNSAYWDLYCLLDMTHPYYRRPEGEIERYELLRMYAEERWKDSSNEAGFLRDYDVFASVYSTWLLFLIDQDLKNGIWQPDRLVLQQSETLSVLLSCLRHYSLSVQ